MAEIATIARPYAEALFKASGANAPALAGEIGAFGQVAADPAMRQFADNPKIVASQVLELLTSVARMPSGAAPSEAAKNLLRTVIDNGRLVALARDRGAVPGPRRRHQRHLGGHRRQRVPDRRRPARRREGRPWKSASAASSKRMSSSSRS